LEKLRHMHPPLRAVVVICLGLLAVCAPLLSRSAADSLDTATGVFVSYGASTSGPALTIQQGERLMVYAANTGATVRERSGTDAWAATSFAQLAQGEPVTLHIDPAGMVAAVDAEYTTVTTRLIVQKNGFVVTTAGVAYRLVGKAAQVQSTLNLGTFLKLRVDPQANTAFDVTASSEPFTGGPLAERISVTVIVTVPTNTPTRDIVYIASDAANWIPNGVRMSPLTGSRWTATLTLGKGSSLKYKYTRGSWETAETNQAGVEIPNRSLSITKTGDGQQVDDVVVRWSDLPS
jgi:hypothetical protein